MECQKIMIKLSNKKKKESYICYFVIEIYRNETELLYNIFIVYKYSILFSFVYSCFIHLLYFV